ncbi:hypothetical protein MMC25_002403 [Agyrium rufum]|nr:hypothetical protein [Agyrium rufum]
MPQRSSYDLHLYAIDGDQNSPRASNQPVHVFQGHNDQVKEFLWRYRGSVDHGMDEREWQMVSWGADRSLLLHQVDEDLCRTIGYERGKAIQRNITLTRVHATYKTFREEPDGNGCEPSGVVQITSIARKTSSKSSGISRVYLPLYNGLENDVFLGTQPVSSPNGIAQRDVDPITWMKGVKIGKREAGLIEGDESVHSIGSKSHDHWEHFKSLGEEITHTSEIFSKVVYDKIDVQRRMIEFSVSGPWGVKGSPTFLKCHVEFPNGYPLNESPKLKIEKTTTIDQIAFERLLAQCSEIGDTYLAHRKSSLEALIRFVTGGDSLISLITRAKQQFGDEKALLVATEEESSSDEDDEELSDYKIHAFEESTLSGSGLLGSAANANVPLPKACGAVWAKNGLLVCFFPKKQDMQANALSNLNLHSNVLSSLQRENTVVGFGNVQMPSRFRSATDVVLGDGLSGGSDTDATSEDEQSMVSSSDSSESSSPVGTSMPLHAFGRKAFGDPRFGSALDDSRSSANHITNLTPPNTVSIHSFLELLPSKKNLAKVYRISGIDVCEHNATVASTQGYNEKALAWQILAFVLKEIVPTHPQRVIQDSPVTLVMQRKLDVWPSRDKKNRMKTHSKIPCLLNRVEWGWHPLGATGLVENLFEHFEHLGDIQMLAVMSCILVEAERESSLDNPSLKTTFSFSGKEPITPCADNIRQSSTSFSDHPWKANQRYFRSQQIAKSILGSPAQRLSLPVHHNREEDSGASSYGAAIQSDPMTPLFTGATPPASMPMGQRGLVRISSNPQRVSASPEHLRHTVRSNSNLATAFASFSRPFSFTASASSSPPVSQPSKRSSTNALVNYAAAAVHGVSRSFSTAEDTTASYYDVQHRASMVSIPKGRKARFRMKLKNQEQFQTEGHAHLPFHYPDREARNRSYRNQYANQLDVWDLLLAKTEILKYNGFSANTGNQAAVADTKEDVVYNSALTSRHDGDMLPSDLNTRPLAFARRCASCGSAEHSTSKIMEVYCEACDEPGSSATAMKDDEGWEDVAAYESLAKNLLGRRDGIGRRETRGSTGGIGLGFGKGSSDSMDGPSSAIGVMGGLRPRASQIWRGAAGGPLGFRSGGGGGGGSGSNIPRVGSWTMERKKIYRE